MMLLCTTLRQMWNMVRVGAMVEAFGPLLYLSTFFLTAIGGNYAALTRLRPRPGYGASGAVMGLYGFMCSHFFRFGQMEEAQVSCDGSGDGGITYGGGRDEVLNTSFSKNDPTIGNCRASLCSWESTSCSD